MARLVRRIPVPQELEPGMTRAHQVRRGRIAETETDAVSHPQFDVVIAELDHRVIAGGFENMDGFLCRIEMTNIVIEAPYHGSPRCVL